MWKVNFMKQWNFKRGLPLILSALLILAGSTVAFATDADSAVSPTMSKDKIRVTSDTLTTNAEANYAEFSGNVKATQGEAYILAERLRIYYNPDASGSQGGASQGAGSLVSGNEAIEKIVASGNVRMRMDAREALAERAEYILKTEILTLTGENTKITEGQNLFTAQTITFYRKESRVKADGGVTIEFIPQGKVLQ